MNKSQQWSLDSWRQKPIQQQPIYKSQEDLEKVLDQVRSLPPLVFVGEIESLKSQMAKAAKGEAFILQGGDCAERFQDCNELAITSKLKILLQMSVVLCYGARKPIVRIGRIAGQYAKPRSNQTENIDGKDIPVYRGDIVNSFEANETARQPDPERILQAFYRSSSTLNFIRSLTKGGFADLHHLQDWDLDFVGKASKRTEYENVVSSIKDAIAFMESLGGREEKLGSVEFYTSHEGLLLPMEEALTQYVPEFDSWYNLGAHMLWIGDRTRQLDGAHVEYFRGIGNPVGIKVGPTADNKDIIDIIKALNPNNKEGKVTIISRYGEGKVGTHLPKLIEAVKSEKLNVVWSSDPMHGNGSKTDSGTKTRQFASILSEVKDVFAAHQKAKSHLAGIHFELTGEDVTECVGGTAGISADDLDRWYETYCDPRLNYSQSLEMAFLVSNILKGQN